MSNYLWAIEMILSIPLLISGLLIIPQILVLGSIMIVGALMLNMFGMLTFTSQRLGIYYQNLEKT